MSLEVASKEKCPRCEAHRNVVAGLTRPICRLAGVGHFDVLKAEELLRRHPRKPEVVTVKQMRRFVTEEAVFPPHCLHVNTRKFLIIGTYLEPATDVGAADELRHFILDGCHRGYIRASLGRTTKAYVLTLEETQSVFIGKRAPRGKRWVRG